MFLAMQRSHEESTELKQAVLELWLEGISYAEVARRMGITRQRVSQIVRPPAAIYKLVLERANGMCEDCGLKIGRGAVHHAKRSPDAIEDFNDVKHLVYLCPPCHRNRHIKAEQRRQPRTTPKDPLAVALGRKGGKARSEAKIRAARLNGLKGGANSLPNPKPEVPLLREGNEPPVPYVSVGRAAEGLGRKGGKKKTERKARAARQNGQLGGDPRKPKIVEVFAAPPIIELGCQTAPIVQISREELRNMYPAVSQEAPGNRTAAGVEQMIRQAAGKHDAKACRIYRCLQCKALGHRDRNRGLL